MAVVLNGNIAAQASSKWAVDFPLQPSKAPQGAGAVGGTTDIDQAKISVWPGSGTDYEFIEPVPTYSYGPPQQKTFFNNDADKLSVLNKQMRQSMDRGLGLNDLSQSLSYFLQQGTESAQQKLDSYSYQLSPNAISEPDFSRFNSRNIGSSSELAFSLTTKSGDRLTFSFRYEQGTGDTPTQALIGYQSLVVDFELDGRLSKAEMAEMLTLADGLNELANAYFADGTIDIDSLNLGELSQVAELEVKLDGGVAEDELLAKSNGMRFASDPDYGLTLRYSDDHESRHLEAVANDNKLLLELDKLGVVDNYDLDRREAALSKYRQMLVDGVNRAEGNDQQKQLLLSAFDAIHGELEEPEETTPINEEEAALLSAVADFRLSFLSAVNKANPLQEALEQKARFSLEFSQETQVSQYANGDRDIDQNFRWKMKGTYFKPLSGYDEIVFKDGEQKYKFFEVQEEVEFRTELERRKGMLVSAEQRIDFDSKTEELTYDNSSIPTWETTKNKLSGTKDLLAQLKADASSTEPTLMMLENLIMDIDSLYEDSTKNSEIRDVAEAPEYLLGKKPMVFPTAAAGVKA